MATLSNIEKKLQEKLQAALATLPTVVVNEAVNWTRQNFRRQGWPGQSFQAWKPRAANARRNAGRGLLIDSGRLSRSIRVISVGQLQATFGTDVPYAAAHNNGFTGTVNVSQHKRNKIGTIKVSTGKSGQPFKNKKAITGTGIVKAHQRRMKLPRRRFIGNSPVLVSILKRKSIVHIARELKK
jgi:phage gpG-like protein